MVIRLRPSRLFYNIIFQYLNWGSALILGIITTKYLANVLDVARFGDYGIMQSSVMMFYAATELGFGVITIREIAKGTFKASHIIGNLTFLKVAQALIFFLLCNVYARLIGFGPEVTLGITVYSLILLLASLDGLQTIILTEFKSQYFFLASLAQSASFLALVLLTSQGMLSISALGLYLFIGAGLRYAIASYYALRLVRPTFNFDKALCLYLFREALPLAGATLISMIYSRYDLILVSKLASQYTTGLYAAAQRLVQTVNFAHIAVAATLLPALSSYLVGDRSRAIALYQRSWDILTAIILPILVVVTVFAEDIIRLFYSSRFDEAALTLRILIWQSVALYSSVSAGTVLTASGRQGVLIFIHAFMMAVNLILNLLLIPRLGQVGAATAAAVSWSLGMLIHNLIVYRYTGFVPNWSSLARVLAATFIMVAILLILPFGAYINTVLGAIAFAGACLYLGVFKPQDIKAVMGLGRSQ